MFGLFRTSLMLIAIAATWLSADLLIACPNCREAVEATSTELQTGYQRSILLLLSMPLVLVAVWTYAGWRIWWQAKSPRKDM